MRVNMFYLNIHKEIIYNEIKNYYLNGNKGYV